MATMTYETSARQPSRTASTPVRLTRRGRVVVIMILFALVTLAFALGRASTADAGNVARAERRSVVVKPGETLWQIARRAVPDADPRETVDRLRDINRLGSATVHAGQRIQLP